MSVLDKSKEWLMSTLKACSFKDVVNLSFSLDVKKISTNELTHFPVKMMQCNGVEDDVLGAILPDSTRDAIFVVKKQNTPHTPTIEVTDVKVHNIRLFAHAAMTCKIGLLTAMAWNVDGRCDSKYSRSQQDNRKLKMIQFLNKIKPDILCLQNYYLRKNARGYSSIENDLRKFVSETRVSVSRYSVFFDGYTDAILVKNELVSKTLSSPIMVPRYGDLKKQTTILFINHFPPFYIVNAHFSTPKKAVSTHQLELNTILMQLNEEEFFVQGMPAVWMGTFNRDNAEELFLKAERRKYTRGGFRRPTKSQTRRLW